jgi:hypothetical protein
MSDNLSAPYMSPGIFKGTLEQLAESTVPTGPLDRRVLDWLSGADYGALMSGMRFLDLVDEQKRATPAFRNLVFSVSDPERYSAALRSILSEKYSPIIGDVDITSGTSTQLEKAFKDYGVPAGQMLSKTIRFYVKTLEDVGIQVSKHITKPKPRPARKNGEKAASKTSDKKILHVTSHAVTIDDKPPKDFERMPIPGIGHAFIQYPVALTEREVTVFEAMVKALRTYAVANKPGQEEPQ